MPDYYDLAAGDYDDSRYLTPEVADTAANFLIQAVSAPPASTFLELGVGTGANVLPLVKRGYAVTGLDPSLPMLEQFRRKLSGPAPNLTLLSGDASALPFLDASFNLVLTVHVLQNIPDWQRVLGEVRRVLKPTGIYAHGEYPLPPHRRDFETHYQTVAQHFRRSSMPDEDTPSEGAAPPRGDFETVAAYLRERGASPGQHQVARWTVSETVGELLGWYEAKAFGSCYSVPDELYPEVMEALRERCLVQYGSLAYEFHSEAVYQVMTARRWGD